MSYSLDRDETIAVLTAEGMNVAAIRILLRQAAILHRLAVAQCNGDWPADNGQRPTRACPKCESHWDAATIRKGKCEDCRAQARVRELLPEGFAPVFGGDPRGCVLKIATPGGAANDWGGDKVWCIPVRNR